MDAARNSAVCSDSFRAAAAMPTSHVRQLRRQVPNIHAIEHRRGPAGSAAREQAASPTTVHVVRGVSAAAPSPQLRSAPSCGWRPVGHAQHESVETP